MFAIPGRSTFTGTLGTSMFGGTIYKTWNGGRNGLVVMNDDYNPLNISAGLIQFQNGFCQSNPTTSDTNGLSNTEVLYALSNPQGAQCQFLAAEYTWKYTRQDFQYWSENDGYGDWWLPARNELEELYSSSYMPSPTVGDGGYYWSSTDAGLTGGYTAGWALSFNTGTWTSYTNESAARVRLIRRF
jgi:hypothetical protein